MTRRPWLLALALAGCAQGIREADPSSVVEIPETTFTMGSMVPSTLCAAAPCVGDRLPRLVKLGAFAIDATEVSLVQYLVCWQNGLCPAAGSWDWDRRNRPAIVPIEAARAYCAQMFPSRHGRLPTEAEWELAARFAGPGRIQPFPWSEAPADCAVPAVGCRAETADVGANQNDRTPAGVHDMAGNLPEWVEDDYTPAPGCQDATPLATLCDTAGASCERLLCPPTSDCPFACAPGISPGAVAYCPPIAGASAIPDPLARTRPASPLFKGGGFELDACMQDPTGRTSWEALPSPRPLVGFRCAYGPTPAPRLSARLLVHPPSDCTTIRVARTAKAADALPTDDDWARMDAVLLDTARGRTPATRSADELVIPCNPTGSPTRSVLLIENAPALAFTLAVAYDGSVGTCAMTQTPVTLDLSLGEYPLGEAVELGQGCP